MVLSTYALIIVMCAVIAKTKEYDINKNILQNELNEAKRFKRAKYYSSPPPSAIKYFRRPAFFGYPKGLFSYTPPPNIDDEETYQHSGAVYPSRPPVIKRPNEGLGDDDINNIVKYLSKQDLDKIIEFAGYKEKIKKSYGQDTIGTEEKLNINGPYKVNNERPAQNHNYNPNFNVVYDDRMTPYSVQTINNNLDTQETMEHNAYINYVSNTVVKDINDKERESPLPEPVNLRHDDYLEGAFTKNVESIAKPLSNYKVENFGALPIMNYHHSKRFKTDSYNVPHYSITTGSASNIRSPDVEPAPDPRVAKSQSDAHLKAVKIWSHRSNGQAYTLHDDGTLSLEKPLRKIP